MSSLLAERLRLIVITDERVPWPEQRPRLAAALAAGAPAVQLRDKTSSTRTLVERACELRALTAAHGALLFVNDRLDVALAAGADGVHLGDDDLPLEAARRWAPPGFLIGRSADTLAQAQEAAAASADYVGVGPVFATPTKPDAGPPLGIAGVGAVARAVPVPVVAVGGVEPAHAAALFAAGVAGVALVRGVVRASDPAAVVRLILAAAASLPPAPTNEAGA